ncbi:phosphoenolpyruvate synthase, partial [Candidatus Gottesmanbacteria bacterium]|nr:phosphoenolpyruvate synthase [Candidatus Gottesmanbacteria bacterium]
MNSKYIAWFSEVGKEDVGLVGGKGANLGEMYKAGIPVPYGFVVTAAAYFDFLKESGLSKKIKDALKLLNHQDPKNLQATASAVQKLIKREEIPQNIAREIMMAYLNLASESRKKASLTKRLSSVLKEPYVAVRSSAT